MKIEVPKDQFKDVVKLMAKKLQTGDRSPAAALRMAKGIVISGNIDVATAHRIVQAGNLDSVAFDAGNSVYAASMAGSFSVAVAYASAIWNGADQATAAREACVAGFKVGGVTWLSLIATAQLSKSGTEATVRGGSQWLVKQGHNIHTLKDATALLRRVWRNAIPFFLSIELALMVLVAVATVAGVFFAVMGDLRSVLAFGLAITYVGTCLVLHVKRIVNWPFI
jgi:hypothetical protein